MEGEKCVQLTLVRHGETEANKNKIIQGQLDTPLSAHGRWQSSMVGRRLATETITHVYTSDLARAVETAELLTAQLNDSVTITTDTRLRERGFGCMEGLPISSLIDAARSAGVKVRDFVPPGGEGLEDVGKRMAEFLSDIMSITSSQSQPPILPKKGTILWDFQHSHTLPSSPSPPPLPPYPSSPSPPLPSSPPPPPPTPHHHILVVGHGGSLHCLLEQLRLSPGCALLPPRSSSTPNTSLTSLLLSLHDSHCVTAMALVAHDASHISPPHPSHSHR